jgi:hypothetical protein
MDVDIMLVIVHEDGIYGAGNAQNFVLAYQIRIFFEQDA